MPTGNCTIPGSGGSCGSVALVLEVPPFEGGNLLRRDERVENVGKPVQIGQLARRQRISPLAQPVDPHALDAELSRRHHVVKVTLRHVHMPQKYGVVPQFPIQRYVLGLTSTKIPDRSGEYPSGAGSYQGLTNLDCTNPLFAASLPDGSSTDPATLCDLPAGTRTPDLVYFAHIGGVPHQLLQQDPTQPDSPPKETLSGADWTKILGNAPEQSGVYALHSDTAWVYVGE